jgi:short-subunit dehydrogenase
MATSHRHIMITGASGGIGSETALALANGNTRLTLLARDPVRLALLAARLAGRAAAVHTIAADLTDSAGLPEIVASATAALGPIDILINCAGVNDFRRFSDSAPAAIEKLILTNVLAPMLLTRAVLPHMLERRRGRVVNIGSVMGGVGFAGFAVYCATKFALRGFSESLRRELKRSGVAVTYIEPRYTRTGLNSAAIARMAKAVGMNTDEPAIAAHAIAAAVNSGKAEHTIGGVERLLIRLNALFPRLIDSGLANTNRRMLDFVEPAE